MMMLHVSLYVHKAMTFKTECLNFVSLVSFLYLQSINNTL
jgi:hypothetical protein